MRLTLRTLLAYLDGVLDRQDAAVLETKVSESENARRLVTRIDEVSRRSQMEPPRVDSRAPSADANAMADYLDGTMPADQVSTHELGCLDSDALLAEAASCHQVLSRVVREPAKVPERTRNRLTRRVLDELEQAGDSVTDMPGSLAGSGSTTSSTRHRHDQSHESLGTSSDSQPLPGVHDMEAGITGLPILKPRDAERDPSRRPLGAAQGTTFVDRSHATAGDSVNAEPDSRDEVGLAGVNDRTENSGLWVAVASVALLLMLTVLAVRGDLQRWFKGTATPVADRSGEAEEPEAGTAGTSSSATSSSDSSALSAPANSGSARSNGAIPLATTPLSGQPIVAAPRPAEPRLDPEPPVGVDSNDNTEVGLPMGDPPPLEIPAATPDVTPAEGTPSPVEPSVTWNHDHTAGLAIYFGPTATDWTFLSSAKTIETDGFVQSMPIDRVHLHASTGLKVELIGATQVAIAEPEHRAGESVPPALDMKFGRLLVSHGLANQQFHLLIGTSDWRVDLIDAGSSLAIERRPWLYPGEAWSDSPSEADMPRHELVQFVVTTGQVNLSDGAITRTLTAPFVLQWFDGEPLGEGVPAGEALWIVETDALSVAARTSTIDAIDMSVNPIVAWRLALASPQAEVSTTALECLSEVGLYDGVWEKLNDSSVRNNWRRRLMASVVQQLRRGEGRAVRFQQSAPDEQQGATALTIMAGFSPEQLEAGADRQLVDWLEDETLIIRALAFEQLLGITGSTELYLPEADRGRRSRSVAAWRERLANQGIQHDTPPAPPALPIPR